MRYFIKKKDLQLRGYLGGDMEERKSTSGYVFLLGNRAISWGSKKQTYVVLSTMEVEFIDSSVAMQKAIWLK